MEECHSLVGRFETANGRQQYGRRESYAANPEDDEDDVNGAGNGNVIQGAPVIVPRCVQPLAACGEQHVKWVAAPGNDIPAVLISGVLFAPGVVRTRRNPATMSALG